MNGACQHCGAVSVPVILSPAHQQARCFSCAGLAPGAPPPRPAWMDTFPAAGELVKRLSESLPKILQAEEAKLPNPRKRGLRQQARHQGLEIGLRAALQEAGRLLRNMAIQGGEQKS